VNRRLYRSRSDRMIGGVAAGIADYLDADSALVRIGWAILVVITGGVALIAYVVAWIVVPEAPSDGVMTVTDAESGDSSPARSVTAGNAGIVVGIGLVLLGVWFLVREYLPNIDWSLLWPLVLVGIGVLILITSMRRREG
jgi:phage shock protein C